MIEFSFLWLLLIFFASVSYLFYQANEETKNTLKKCTRENLELQSELSKLRSSREASSTTNPSFDVTSYTKIEQMKKEYEAKIETISQENRSLIAFKEFIGRENNKLKEQLRLLQAEETKNASEEKKEQLQEDNKQKEQQKVETEILPPESLKLDLSNLQTMNEEESPSSTDTPSTSRSLVEDTPRSNETEENLPPNYVSSSSASSEVDPNTPRFENPPLYDDKSTSQLPSQQENDDKSSSLADELQTDNVNDTMPSENFPIDSLSFIENEDTSSLLDKSLASYENFAGSNVDLTPIADKTVQVPDLNLPDVLKDLVEHTDEDFDLSSFKKKSVRKGMSKRAMSKSAFQAGNQEEEDFLNSMKKTSKAKEPSFMSIFKSEGEIKASKEPRKPWHSGSSVIHEFGVKEDPNPKAKKRRRGITSSSSSKAVQYMEDEHYVAYPFENDPTKALFCVFDGHGGSECSKTAKEIFHKIFQDNLEKATDFSDLTQVFQQTFLEVDTQLKEFEYMGSTASVVFFWESDGHRFVQAANVGDSTAFLKIENDQEQVVALTIDHKASNPDEQERIKLLGAEMVTGQTRVGGGLAVSRALGDHFLKNEKVGLIGEPYVSPPFNIDNSDGLVILASDGLWDVVTGEEAMKSVETLDDAGMMARHLVNDALADSTCTDNITVFVILL